MAKQSQSPLRKLRRQQVVADLLVTAPEAWRLAALLSGREDMARDVLRYLLARAVRAWPTWSGMDEQRDWFFHHTLLTVRRARKAPPDPAADLLLRHRGGQAGDYMAFVRALRGLPFQQAEAFLLFDVLGLDLRGSAVTMDLSRTATANHLEAARTTLRSLTGDRYSVLLDEVRIEAHAYAPDELILVPSVESAVRRYLWPRRLKRLATLLVVVAAIVAVYAAWGLLLAAVAWGRQVLGYT